jgi:tetratricopeptide (TPR) repeat protein
MSAALDTKGTLSRADELNGIGAQLFAKGEMAAARMHFLGALRCETNHSQALQNLGATLRNMGANIASLAVAERSVAVTKRANPYALSNLGVAKLACREFHVAHAILREVTEKLPESGPSWHNLGLCEYMLGMFEQALASFDKSLRFAQSPQAASDRALALLALERLTEGLEAYENRWLILRRNRIWDFELPEWQGEDLADKHILVHHEQGFGDSIMLVRFIYTLFKRGAKVTLAVPKELVELFSYALPFVNVMDIDNQFIDRYQKFDYHSPMLSVMRHLHITSSKEISARPYLTVADDKMWRIPQAKLRVGICWASGDHSPSMVERRRMVPLALFAPLLSNPNIALVSLQKGPDSNDIENMGLGGLIHDPMPNVENFADTAQIMSQLDVVISVDSAVAHLAGAIGKQCLMLGPFSRCWRWWGGRLGLPWYEKMMIFPQSEDGAWNTAMADVRQTVLQWAE